MASAVLGPIAPGETPGPNLVRAAEELCRDAEAQGAIDAAGNIDEDRAVPLLRKHASRLFAPICDRLADGAREASPAEMLRYVRDDDFKRFADGFCAVVGDYIGVDGSIDQRRLFAAHPQLVTPFCVAGIRAELDGDPQSPVPENKLGVFARRLCARLFKEDLVVATGPGQFRVRRESPKYERALREALADIG